MEYEEALTYIHSRKRLPSKGSLERISVLLARMGRPEQQLSFVHVTGTNGKGSASVMISRILEAESRKTGLFTSPYLCDYRERFQINGKMIDKDRLAALVEKIQSIVDPMEQEGYLVTEFELGTAIAFQYFLEEKCDMVVLEVGIGGKHDATNVIPPPLVSVMMQIGLDHTAMLGGSLEEIAAEKVGIIKGNPVVCHPIQKPEALAVVMERCAQTGSPLAMPSGIAVKILPSDFGQTAFEYGGETFAIPLNGEHQAYNAVTVIEAARLLGAGEGAIREGLSQAFLPARMEIVRKEPLILLDGAHNPDAIGSLCRNVIGWGLSPLTVVIGMMRDKDLEEALRLLAGAAKRIRTVCMNDARAIPAEELAQKARRYCEDSAAFQSMDQAAQWISRQQTPVAICGSFYLAGELRSRLL